jgi:hypothetical protein
MSAIILGLQKLNIWTGVAFSPVAIVTVVNTLEPFFCVRRAERDTVSSTPPP